MGRPRLPTAIKKQRGTDQPCRILKDEMQPAPLVEYPLPPDWLTPDGQSEWHNVVSGLHALGMLSKLDLAMVASYCNEMALYREMELKVRGNDRAIAIKDTNGTLRKLDIVAYQKIAHLALDKALAIAREFGFTPAARTKISMGQIAATKPSASNNTDDAEYEFDI
jgi:P27 family predicted phage terminase small subunit